MVFILFNVLPFYIITVETMLQMHLAHQMNTFYEHGIEMIVLLSDYLSSGKC